jgi:uncharacterized protein (DUF302 family)
MHALSKVALSGGFALAAMFNLSGSVMAQEKTPPGYTRSVQQVRTDHVTIHVDQNYETVTTRIQSDVGRFTDDIRVLLAAGKYDEVRAALQKSTERHGLAIHLIATHGAWLALNGEKTKGVVYHLGNVLSAVSMTGHNFGAALYAPLRVVVYEPKGGGTTFEYDTPLSQFGQFHNAEIDKTAKSLDDRMLALIKFASQ